jgi:hypothetical protein
MKMLSLTRVLSFTISRPEKSKLKEILKAKVLVN